MLAFGGHVTTPGSGGAAGATGRLTFTRGMALGSRPMYTTSRASGSTAHTADSVTLAQRPATGADEFRWQYCRSPADRLLEIGGAPPNDCPIGMPHTCTTAPV